MIQNKLEEYANQRKTHYEIVKQKISELNNVGQIPNKLLFRMFTLCNYYLGVIKKCQRAKCNCDSKATSLIRIILASSNDK